MASKRRTLTILLTLLALFLLGTVAVLSTISFYLRIDPSAYITEEELSSLSENSTDRSPERIPRIIHQTWKNETLPERWRGVSRGCRDLMPDYEYMLWTDASSREFIETYYPWFLPTFDAYPYSIQRADAIRYFVLHHYGGVYLDLDVGCLRPLDPLLVFPVILPKTIPVGISNDLMFAAKNHPFMEQTIHNLVTFDHSYILNYPTVMFSTGPMFLSAQFGLYVASHPASPENPGGHIRVLPKALYGKNTKPGEAPHSFFRHHYGSSWHADDAAFITFLGKWGRALMWFGLAVLVFGTIRLFWQKRHTNQRGERLRGRFPFGRYGVVFPLAFQRDGSFHLDLEVVTMSEPSGSPTEPISPSASSSGTNSPEPQALPLSFVSTPMPSEDEHSHPRRSISDIAARAFRQAGSWVRSSVTSTPNMRSRRRRSRGVTYFLPAIFTPSPRSAPGEHSIPLLAPQIPLSSSQSRSQSPHSLKEDVERYHAGTSTRNSRASSSTSQPPPPYDRGGENEPPTAADWAAGENSWEEWTGDDERLA